MARKVDNLPKRKVNDIIYIIPEGKKCEYNYFLKLKNEILEIFKSQNINNPRINVIEGKGGHPRNTLKKAIECKEEIEPDIWLVFDCDEHKNVDDIIKEAYSKGFKVIFSNPCFELWLYCYLGFHSTNINKDDISKKFFDTLKKECKIETTKDKADYGKIFETLENKERRDKAIAHAKRICKDKSKTSATNPYTNVYELVERLQGFLT